MMPVAFIASTICGFLASFFVSHPNHPTSIKHKIPNIKIKWIQITPNLKVTTRSYEIHLHHWLWMIAIYITFTVYQADILASHMVIQGFLFGGLGQGLTYSDRFIFIQKKNKRAFAYLVFAYTRLLA